MKAFPLTLLLTAAMVWAKDAWLHSPLPFSFVKAPLQVE